MAGHGICLEVGILESRAKSIRRIADFRELQLLFEQNWLLNIDNLDGLKPEISDAFAAAITGDSDLRRVLYTDQDLLLLDYMRPKLLNGISHPVERPDLLDRSILITLERISENLRREEEEMWLEFEAVLPDILGGAFDILARAMAIRPTVRIETKPRMADFAAWGYAIAEAAGWGGAAFLAAYERNIKHQHEEAVAAAVVAQVVIAFMENRDEWQGTASALKLELDDVAIQQGIDPKNNRSGWPKDPARLSKMRSRVINMERPDLLDRSILITLERISENLRREEEEMWPEFEAALPDILGGAFDILARAMVIRPTVRIETKPRMADFAAWGYAIAEAAGWGGAAFLAAYERNIKHQHEEAVGTVNTVGMALSWAFFMVPGSRRTVGA